MAAGNHEEKGYCALLVIASKSTQTSCQCLHPPEWLSLTPSKIRNTASPTRLVSAVIIPLPSDLRFLK